MLRRESLSSRLTVLGLSTTLLLMGMQRQVTASPASDSTPKVAAGTQVTPPTKLPLFGKLELPPLGDPSQFIPVDKPVNPFEDVHLVLRLRERRVYVYRKDQVQSSYPVAVGKAGWETPTGNFKILQMIKEPSWEHPWTGEVVPPGPDNPLGSRWIGFWTDGKNVIGFHGTPNPESVGRPASHGCVRMFDKDVQSLFEKVNVGTPVIVEP
ncbi:MAG: L,D-transpeptidase [Actinomycetota bacterium]